MHIRLKLIHPPHSNSTDDRLDPPLGLLLIASYLNEVYPEVTVTVSDLSGQSPDQWEIGEADIYGITTYAPSLSTSKEIAFKCRAVNPSCKVVVGGAFPSSLPDQCDFADYVVIGEGEIPMTKILGGVKSKVLCSVNHAPFLFPAYHLVDLNTYHRTIDGTPSMPYLTSRGCPYKCAFCGLHLMHESSKVRFCEPNLVGIHLKRIKDLGFGAVNFQDDNFTMRPSRLFQILDLIKPLGLKFRCHGRAGQDTEETYKRLADAGCSMVAWGIESGSQKILDKMNKQVLVEQNFEVIQWAKKYGITSRAFFIIGFPGETEDTIEETRRFIQEADPDQYFVSNFVPYPGTPVWNDPHAYGITEMSKDFDQYYQVSKDGTGGLTIDTQWLSRTEFRALEEDFRRWLQGRPMRGKVLDYESKLIQRAVLTPPEKRFPYSHDFQSVSCCNYY